jgi:DNA polymerase-3 subunit alpha
MGTPEQIVRRAVELGWPAAALTEHGWMGSAPDFYRMCRADRWPGTTDNPEGERKPKLKPIIGCEMYVVPDHIFGVRDKAYRSSSNHLTVLALTRKGYHNLVVWNTESMQGHNFYHRPRISLERMVEIAPYPLHHNVVLSGCMGSELVAALHMEEADLLGPLYVDAMRTIFLHFYIEVQDHRIDKYMGRDPVYDEMVEHEMAVRESLVSLARQTDTSLILTNDSHYQYPSQRKAHMAMLFSKPGMNTWRQDDAHAATGYTYWASYLRSLEEVAGRHEWGQEALDSIAEVVTMADIVLDPLDNFTYSIPFSGRDDPLAAIRRTCRPRLKQLVGNHGRVAEDRFEHELKAMGDFAHYLLFMSDLCQWCRDQGVLTNTRGSAANSIVCYCLGIHNIDSISYKLTFERFVNPEREKLPDIDIDMQYDRYEDVIRFVSEWVEEREGKGQLAPICNYGTLANRSTFRMIAGSLGISEEVQNEIAELLPQMIDSGLVEEEGDIYTALKENYPDIYELAAGVFDSLKNVSQHACGWVLGTEARPLSEWMPMYWIASSSKLVTQYGFKMCEKLGLLKADLLRLKTLTIVARCLALIGKNPLDLEQIPLDDPDTFQMIREGRTDGVFTLQGKTNRAGAMDVEASEVHDIIASVAIYRPSVTRPGFHKVYNRRRRGEEEVAYPHPVAEQVLGETHGLPIFQEQTMELGYAVGMTHSEVQMLLDAIKLAKGVGRGAAEAFEKIKPTFMKCARTMMSAEAAEEIWAMIGGFQGYGFNRGHSTSYGILAVRAAYLKCHYPQEFFTSLLDVYPEVGRYIAAVRNEGFKILPPDINESGAGFTRGQRRDEIRCGLAKVKGVGPVALKAIMSGQPYSGFNDLRARTPSTAVDKTVVENLAAVGALESLGIRGRRGIEADIAQFELLGFTLDTPQALRIEESIRHTRERRTSTWHHLGYTADMDFTPVRCSVSKLFWIPDIEDDKKFKLLELKASPWARVKTWLLKAIDINGIVFEIRVPQDKLEEAAYLDFISRKHRGSAICLDGAIRQSFDRDGPLTFALYDVTGAMQEDAQVWHAKDDKLVRGFELLHRRKRAARKNAKKRAA